MNCWFFRLNPLFLSWFRSDHGPNAWMPSVTIWWAENIWMEANTLNARLVGKTSPLRHRQWHTRHVSRTLLFRCLNRQADAEMTWCRFGCPMRRTGIPNNASRVMDGQQCHRWRLERQRRGRCCCWPESPPNLPPIHWRQERAADGGHRSSRRKAPSSTHGYERPDTASGPKRHPPAIVQPQTHTHSDVIGMAEGAMQVPMCSSSAPLSTGMPSNSGPGGNHGQAGFFTPLP